MVEIVIALLMYIGIDLKEHVPYDNIGDCLKAKRLSERSSVIDGPRLE